MACRLCQLPIESTRCEVCRFLTEEELPIVPAACDQCGFPIENAGEADGLCHLCAALFDAVQHSCWLVRAHDAWEQENILLARRKWELTGTGGPPAW